MIKIQTLDLIENVEHIVIPTIFPDGTSQVWKLPDGIINSLNTKVTWNFENEAELMHLASLKELLKGHSHLHVPYLPYARQDKSVNNNKTFNLYTFSKFLNSLGFDIVTAVDVHNPEYCNEDINHFRNIKIDNFIQKSLEFTQTDGIIFPDYGANKRYKTDLKSITCEKARDSLSGEIMGHKLEIVEFDLNKAKRVLIVDDICDGGATFISVAKMLKKINPELFIDLFVTHGIFSKGKQILHDAGIDNIFTTNSLLKNKDGFKV